MDEPELDPLMRRVSALKEPEAARRPYLRSFAPDRDAGQGDQVEEHQRRFLLASYEGFVADVRGEAEAEGTPSAGNRYWIDNCDRTIG